MAVLIVFVAALFVCGTASAATQTIDGDPVDVEVYDGGKIVPYYDNWDEKYQYYDTVDCSNVLWLDGTSLMFENPYPYTYCEGVVSSRQSLTANPVHGPSRPSTMLGARECVSRSGLSTSMEPGITR